MKITFVTRWGVQCGIATYTDQLTLSLLGQKHKVSCAAEKLIGIREIPVQSTIPMSRVWDGRKGDLDGIFDYLKKQRPDVVHFQHEFGLMDTAAQLMGIVHKISALNIPVFFTCHTVMTPPSDKAWMFRELLGKVSGVVAHNDDTRRALRRWNLAAKKIRVIPHGTPEGCSLGERLESRKKVFLPEDPNTVIAISLGFISPGKMQHEAVDAILFLVKEGLLDPAKFLYIIAGSPGQGDEQNMEYCRELHRKVEAARAWNFIRIYPTFVPRDQLEHWYGAADFVITGSHPTFYSVSGRSHQEMAYGMASISSRSHLLSDLNEERSLKYDSVVQLRSHILAMVRDPNLRHLMSRRCKQFAEDTSWTNVAKAHVDFYKSVLKKG